MGVEKGRYIYGYLCGYCYFVGCSVLMYMVLVDWVGRSVNYGRRGLGGCCCP